MRWAGERVRAPSSRGGGGPARSRSRRGRPPRTWRARFKCQALNINLVYLVTNEIKVIVIQIQTQAGPYGVQGIWGPELLLPFYNVN